jgi:hypothetical protein
LQGAKRKLKNKAKQALRPHNPSFIIIGAQKSGTSSLHHYLNQHPDLVGSKPKEIHFFNREIYFQKDIHWYKNHFKSVYPNKTYFESTPAYLYQPDTAKLIKKYYPDIKLIAILRDPVKRAYSAWNHYRDIFDNNIMEKAIKNKNRRSNNLLYEKFFKERTEFPSFEECINIELELMQSDIYEPALLRRGLYIDQIKQYWNYFGKNNVLTLGFMDFVDNFEYTMSHIARFIDIKDIDWNNLDRTPKNTRQYKEPINNETKNYLEDFYSIPNQRLFSEIGHIRW